MRRRVAVLLAVLVTACARAPVSDDVTVEVEKNDRVRVTAQTTFNDTNVKSEARMRIVEAARFAALNNNGPWAARFGRVTAEDEEVTAQKHRGELDRVIRSVRIPQNQIQQVFSDTNITVSILDGPGWSELSFIPGGSIRATREQRKHFDESLDSWSNAVARYFTTVDHLYTYLDLNPLRAADLFGAILGDDSVVLAEEEQPFVEAVTGAMEEIATRMDGEQEGGAATFGEEADLVYNAFPARITVRVPGEVIATDGFAKELVIEPIDLLKVITSLEGKWISPDPLALLLREDAPPVEGLARTPRMSTKMVHGRDVADAIREQLARPKNYVVRWRE